MKLQSKLLLSITVSAALVAVMSTLLLGWHVLNQLESAGASMLPVAQLKSDVSGTMSVIAVVAVAFSGLLGWLLARHIATPVNQLMKDIQGFSSAKPDLSRRLEVPGGSDIAELAAGLNRFIAYLDQTVSDLLTAAVRV